MRRWVSSESPQSTTVDRAPLDQLGVWLFHKLLLPVTPSWRLITWRETRGEADALASSAPTEADKDLITKYDRRNRTIGTIWVAVVTVGLVLMWRANPSSDATRDAFAGLAAWRWLEIFTVGLGVALGQSESVLGHSLVTIGLWALQATLVFAILEHSLTPTDFVVHAGTPAAETATHAFQYLYIAWTQMVTVGNAFEATTDGARALTMAASTSGVLLLAVFVASAIARSGKG
jgi:hypothetical protein